MNKRLLLFVVFLYTFQISFAQLSTKHYIPPVVTSPNDPPSESYIYISTPKDNVSFTVTPVGNISESYSNIVSNSSPFLYRIVRPGQDPGDINAALDDDGNSQLSAFHNVSNTKTSNKGYIIEASDVIYVSVRFRSNSTYQAGALVSKEYISLLKLSNRASGEENSLPTVLFCTKEESLSASGSLLAATTLKGINSIKTVSLGEPT